MLIRASRNWDAAILNETPGQCSEPGVQAAPIADDGDEFMDDDAITDDEFVATKFEQAFGAALLCSEGGPLDDFCCRL